MSKKLTPDIHCRGDSGQAVGVVHIETGHAGHRPHAEGDGGNAEIGFAERAEFHCGGFRVQGSDLGK